MNAEQRIKQIADEAIEKIKAIAAEKDEWPKLGIDDLQARAPKPLVNEQADKTMKDYAVRLLSRRQYTEQQMCDAYDEIYGPVKSVVDRKQYMSWMECARYTGAIPK